MAGRLSQRHRVVALDYFGHGLSDRSHGLSYGTALWARQAIAVLGGERPAGGKPRLPHAGP